MCIYIGFRMYCDLFLSNCCTPVRSNERPRIRTRQWTTATTIWRKRVSHSETDSVHPVTPPPPLPSLSLSLTYSRAGLTLSLLCRQLYIICDKLPLVAVSCCITPNTDFYFVRFTHKTFPRLQLRTSMLYTITGLYVLGRVY